MMVRVWIQLGNFTDMMKTLKRTEFYILFLNYLLRQLYNRLWCTLYLYVAEKTSNIYFLLHGNIISGWLGKIFSMFFSMFYHWYFKYHTHLFIRTWTSHLYLSTYVQEKYYIISLIIYIYIYKCSECFFCSISTWM